LHIQIMLKPQEKIIAKPGKVIETRFSLWLIHICVSFFFPFLFVLMNE